MTCQATVVHASLVNCWVSGLARSSHGRPRIVSLRALSLEPCLSSPGRWGPENKSSISIHLTGTWGESTDVRVLRGAGLASQQSCLASLYATSIISMVHGRRSLQVESSLEIHLQVCGHPLVFVSRMQRMWLMIKRCVTPGHSW